MRDKAVAAPAMPIDLVVHVDGVGPVRLLNAHQQSKLKRCCRAKRYRLELALMAGMTLRRFNALPADRQDEIRSALLWLTCPTRFGPMR